MFRKSKWENFNHSFVDDPYGDEQTLKRLQLLTHRRMHQLGIGTYAEFADASGINTSIIRQVMAGHKTVGPSLATQWLDVLQLDEEDAQSIISWFSVNKSEQQFATSDPQFSLSIAIEKYEKAEFHKNPVVANSLYNQATQHFRLLVQSIPDSASGELQLIRAEALYRLACLELNYDLADRAYWHAQEAAFLARSLDGDLFLLAKKEAARACFHFGRTNMWKEGLRITEEIVSLGGRSILSLGKRFHEQPDGFWKAMTYRDVINMLIRRRDRPLARDMLAELRLAMRPTEEAIHEFLFKTSEARLQIREGHSTYAMRILSKLYDAGLPEVGGPPHYMTLLSTIAEAQILGNLKDHHGRNYLFEALQWARASGLNHSENELRLKFKDQLVCVAQNESFANVKPPDDTPLEENF